MFLMIGIEICIYILIVLVIQTENKVDVLEDYLIMFLYVHMQVLEQFCTFSLP